MTKKTSLDRAQQHVAQVYGDRDFVDLDFCALALASEAGEVAGVLAGWRYGKQGDSTLAEELADVFFILALMCSHAGLSLQSVYERAMHKHSDRARSMLEDVPTPTPIVNIDEAVGAQRTQLYIAEAERLRGLAFEHMMKAIEPFMTAKITPRVEKEIEDRLQRCMPEGYEAVVGFDEDNRKIDLKVVKV